LFTAIFFRQHAAPNKLDQHKIISAQRSLDVRQHTFTSFAFMVHILVHLVIALARPSEFEWQFIT
jgi:hypothetical protein